PVREKRGTLGSGSPRRQRLADRLSEMMAVADDCGLVRRVYIWGSFVKSKPNPEDMDVLVVVKAGLQDQEIAGQVRSLLTHREARLRFNADVFWVREDIGEALIQSMLEVYQFDRDKRRRGIVEVIR